MKQLWAASELAGLPGLPSTARGVNLVAKRFGWTSEIRQGRGGGRVFHLTNLTTEQVAALISRSRVAQLADAPGPASCGPPSTAGGTDQENAGSNPAPGPAAPTTALAVVSTSQDRGLGLTPSKQALLDFRLGVINRFKLFHRQSKLPLVKAMQAFCAGGAGGAARDSIAWPTLHRWLKRYRKHGSAGLLDRRGRSKGGAIEQSAALQDLIVGIVLHQPLLSSKQIHQLVSQSLNGTAPSHGQIQRFIRRWKRDHQAALAAVTDPRRWNNQFRFAFADRSEGIARFGQLVEVDATPSDALCIDGRHAVICMVDVGTRTTRWRVNKTVKSAAVALLLRDWIVEFGPMEELHGDNGKEFVSKHFQRVLADLDIIWNPSTPYSPWQKPFVERAIGTMSHDLLPLLPGYEGSNVAEKQRIRDRLSMAERRGKSNQEVFRVRLTGEQLQQHLDNWSRNIYGNQPHDGLSGRTPNEMLAELLPTRTRGPLADSRALDLLMAEAPGGDGMRTVGKHGISVDGAYFHCAELAGLEGRQVRVLYDPADMGRVIVYSEQGAFICIAENPERAGFDRATAAMLTRQAQDRVRTQTRQQARRLIRAIKPHKIIDAFLESHSGNLMAGAEARPTEASQQEEVWTTRALDAAADAVAAREPNGGAGVPARHEDLAAIAEIEQREAERARILSEREALEITDDELWALYCASDGSDAAFDTTCDAELAAWRAGYCTSSTCRSELSQQAIFGPRMTPAQITQLASSGLAKLKRRWSQERNALQDRTRQQRPPLAACG